MARDSDEWGVRARRVSARSESLLGARALAAAQRIRLGCRAMALDALESGALMRGATARIAQYPGVLHQGAMAMGAA